MILQAMILQAMILQTTYYACHYSENDSAYRILPIEVIICKL